MFRKFANGLFCEVGLLVPPAREFSVLTVLSVFIVLTELMAGNILRRPFSRSLRRNASLLGNPIPGGPCEALRGVSILKREAGDSKWGGIPLPSPPGIPPLPSPLVVPLPRRLPPKPGGTPKPLDPTKPLSAGGTEGAEPSPGVPRLGFPANPLKNGGSSLLGSG